jgi:hypothetical protein
VLSFLRRKPVRRVRFLTRRGCHLCEVAFATLVRHAERGRLTIEVVDIDSDPELGARHGERVPVVEIDGKERFFGKVDEVLLRRLLDRAD